VSTMCGPMYGSWSLVPHGWAVGLMGCVTELMGRNERVECRDSQDKERGNGGGGNVWAAKFGA